MSACLEGMLALWHLGSSACVKAQRQPTVRISLLEVVCTTECRSVGAGGTDCGASQVPGQAGTRMNLS